MLTRVRLTTAEDTDTDTDESDDEEKGTMTEIPVQLDDDELLLAIKFMKYNHGTPVPSIPKPMPSQNFDLGTHLKNPFYAEFLAVDVTQLGQMLKAASVLDIPPMAELATARLVNIVWQLETPEATAKWFKINPENTPEEDARVRAQYPWLEAAIKNRRSADKSQKNAVFGTKRSPDGSTKMKATQGGGGSKGGGSKGGGSKGGGGSKDGSKD